MNPRIIAAPYQGALNLSTNRSKVKNILLFDSNAFYHLSQYLAHFIPISVIPPWEILEYPLNRYWNKA